MNCRCSDCNNVVSARVLPTNKCQCQAPKIIAPVIITNSTNSTSPAVINSFTNVSCSCTVDFQGLCPQVDLLKQDRVDDGTCEASNRLQSPIPTINTNCKNQYVYLVAVVAPNQDSNVLMQLQSYDYQSAFYIKLSLMVVFISITAMLY